MAFSWLNLFLVLLAAWLAGSIAWHLGYSAVLGEVVAGIILGPSLLGVIHSDDGVAVLGYLGILMMSFFVGTRIRTNGLSLHRGAALPLVGGFLVPLIAGVLVMTIVLGANALIGLVVGTVMGTTGLLAMVRFVGERGLRATRVGQTLLTVALFSMVLVMVTFAAVQGMIQAQATRPVAIALVLGKLVLFLVVFIGVGRYFYPVLGRLQERLVPAQSETGELAFAVLLALLAAWAAERFGLPFILGSFLAGLFLRPQMFEQDTFPKVFEAVRDVSRGFLSVVFYVSAGFWFSFATFSTGTGLVITVVLTAVLTKFLGGFLFHLFNGYGWREGLVLGLGMNARGSLDIAIALLALRLGIITQDVYTALICSIILGTLIVPALLSWGADWLERRGELFSVEGIPVPRTAAAGGGGGQKVTL